MKKYSFLLSMFLIISASSAADVLKDTPPGLCVAVRGNGENLFAHWPALAQIVEHYGPIDVLSGGSSASISIFLYESINKNPLLSCPNNKATCIKQKSLEISLLLKSLQGYFDYWITTEEVNALKILYTKSPQFINSLKFWKKSVEESVDKNEFENLSLYQQAKVLSAQANILLNSTDLVKVINPTLINFLKSGVTDLKNTSIFDYSEWKNKIEVLKFRVREVKDSASIVLSGGFDAKNDGRLFFRPGLISFEDISHKFGRIADFYAGYFYEHNFVRTKTQPEITYAQNLKNFLQVCTPNSLDKSWTQIAYKDYLKDELSNCGLLFRNLVKGYREQLIKDEKNNIPRRHRTDSAIGEYVPNQSMGLFPTTAILDRAQSDRYAKLNKEYYKTTDKDFGINYSVPYSSVSFGYWGSAEHIKFAKNNIEHGPYSNDLKSQKMLGLGQTTWHTVISVSGAEPGLSPIKLITDRHDGIYSIGGWSDLHPTILLKSLNCKNTVYVTRINGETVFGQGVVKRLFNLQVPAWDRIDPKGAEVTRKNNNTGDPTDKESYWGKLYNIANPMSSMSRSIRAADAVWCTDWDSFNIKDGYTAMMEESYGAKFYINQSSKSKNFFQKSYAALKPITDKNVLINLDSHTYDKGWPSFAGCVPLDH